VNNREQELKDLTTRCDILIHTVHEMNELIHELRDENQELRKIIEDLYGG